MSDGSVKRNRAWAVLAALAIALAGLAWTGCGDDENATTNEATESIEQGANEAQERADEGIDEAEENLGDAKDDAQKRIEEGKEEAQEKIDEAKEEVERYVP